MMCCRKVGVSPRKLSVPGVPKMFTSHCTTSRKRIPELIATHYGSYYSVIPPEFINVCKGLHNFTRFHTRVEGVTSRDYEADRGLKEGCPSSPPLFNLYHQAVLADFRIRRKRTAARLGLTAGVEWNFLWMAA